MTVTLHAWPPDPRATPRCLARAFASEPGDLDVSLAAAPALVPAAITRLLVGCVRDADDAANWTVPQRRQALLAIAHATLGDTLPALARCTALECRSPVELELGLASFAAASPDVAKLDVAGHRVECRLPTGADLAAWTAEGGHSPAWLARRLITRVDAEPPAPHWRLPDDWVTPVGAALAEADALATLEILVDCPVCAAPVKVSLDLEPLLLGALRNVAREALEDVHRLAQVYHWREADILGMPRERRRAYLARVQRETA